MRALARERERVRMGSYNESEEISVFRRDGRACVLYRTGEQVSFYNVFMEFCGCDFLWFEDLLRLRGAPSVW